MPPSKAPDPSPSTFALPAAPFSVRSRLFHPIFATHFQIRFIRVRVSAPRGGWLRRDGLIGKHRTCTSVALRVSINCIIFYCFHVDLAPLVSHVVQCWMGCMPVTLPGQLTAYEWCINEWITWSSSGRFTFLNVCHIINFYDDLMLLVMSLYFFHAKFFPCLKIWIY